MAAPVTLRGQAALARGAWTRTAFAEFLADYRRPALHGIRPWQGEPGMHVMVLHECGHGDALMLVRYAEELARRGCVVYWQGTRALVGLLQTAPGVTYELVSEAGTPVVVNAWVRALDLPAILGATPTDVKGARVPYLRPHWKLAYIYRPPLRARRLGICWHGGLDHGYGPARDLTRDQAKDMVRRIPAVWTSLCPGELLDGTVDGIYAGDPFLETAHVIRGLDAVITTDTAVAHLAGAMGAPTYLLLHAPDPDWRWTGAWYPTVTCVYQQRPGDWSTVIDHVCAELA